MKGTLGAARVAVLADDLIWATRLADQLRAVGATPVPCRTLAQLEAALATGVPGAATTEAADPPARVDAVVIDLTARAYDGIEAVRLAAASGDPVVAVGQHDDHELRRRAIEAGARKVFPYRRLAEDGPALLGLWLASTGGPDILRHADPVPEASGRTAP